MKSVSFVFYTVLFVSFTLVFSFSYPEHILEVTKRLNLPKSVISRISLFLTWLHHWLVILHKTAINYRKLARKKQLKQSFLKIPKSLDLNVSAVIEFASTSWIFIIRKDKSLYNMANKTRL